MKKREKHSPPLPVYARVDLTTGSVERYPISGKYFKKYIGGKCLAARLLLDLTPPGIDPLSPEAVIIINTGPLNGTGSPSSSRFNLSFKNVMTGGIASSNCGGQFGVMLKRAGFDGLIISGRAAEPSMLEILDGEVTLKPAPELWGLDAEKTQAARLTQEKQAQEASLPALERAAKQAREQLPLAEENVRLVKRLESCLKFLEKRQKDMVELARLDRLQTKALEDSNRAEQEYLAVRQAYYRSQSGLLARELREGEPCPVCGATHHPAPAVLQEGGATQEQFQAADDHRKRLEEQLHKISSQTAAARAALETLQKTLQEEGIGDEDTEQSVRQRMNEADAAARKIREAAERTETRRSQCQSRLEKAAVLLEACLKKTGELEKEADRLDREFAAGLAQQGFEDETAYRAACLTAEETERLDGAIRRYEEKKKSLNDRVQEREKQLKDSARADIEALLQQQKAMTEQYRQAQERSRGCDRRLTLHQEAGKAIRRAAEQKKAHAEEWAVLDDLYRAMSGQLSQKVKITFETYVQQYYFKQVVAAANKRLTQMTDGMFVLRLKEEAKDRRSQSGLDLDVLDRATGQWRDVSTLSGGESFLASLSLALGLSDVVQSESGGVRLEAMFIDEGFGTLDENALRNAMALLSSLADGDRMIGVISHMPELRERIDKKIVVHKKLTGSEIELEY